MTDDHDDAQHSAAGGSDRGGDDERTDRAGGSGSGSGSGASGASGVAPAWLLGRWRFLRAGAALDFVPGTRMEFLPRGELRYAVPVDGREHVIALLYRVEGDVLRTDNPAAPHATATRFHQGAGGVLVFDFASAHAVFVREA